MNSKKAINKAISRIWVKMSEDSKKVDNTKFVNIKPFFQVNKLKRLRYLVNNCNMIIKKKLRFIMNTISFRKKK